MHAHTCSWSSLNRGRGREGFLYRSCMLVLSVLRKAANSIYSMMSKTSKILGELIGMNPTCANPLHGWWWPWSWHLIAGPTVLPGSHTYFSLYKEHFLSWAHTLPVEQKRSQHITGSLRGPASLQSATVPLKPALLWRTSCLEKNPLRHKTTTVTVSHTQTSTEILPMDLQLQIRF